MKYFCKIYCFLFVQIELHVLLYSVSPMPLFFRKPIITVPVSVRERIGSGNRRWLKNYTSKFKNMLKQTCQAFPVCINEKHFSWDWNMGFLCEMFLQKLKEYPFLQIVFLNIIALQWNLMWTQFNFWVKLQKRLKWSHIYLKS